MAESIVVACETCGQRFKAPASAVGKQTSCSFCGGAITIQAAGNPEESMSGFVDLTDGDDFEPAADDRRSAPAPRRPRERGGIFDLGAGDPPADELPRRGQRSGGTGRRTRDTGRRSDTGRRGGTGRREAPDDMRASRAGNRSGTGRRDRDELAERAAAAGMRASGVRRGDTGMMRRSGINRAPSTAAMGGAKPLPWLWIGVGAGALLIAIVGGLMVSSANARRAEEERIAKEKADKKRAEEQAKAERIARNKELYQQYLAAQTEAEKAAEEDLAQFDRMNAERKAQGGTETPRSDFYSERAANLFVKAGRIAANVNHEDKATYCYKKALEYYRDHKEAHLLLEHEKYRKPTERKPDDHVLQELYTEGFLDELDRYHDRFFPKTPADSFEVDGVKMISIEEIDALERKLVSEGQVDLTKMKEDPYFAAVRQVKRNLASQEILKEFNWRSRDARPYVVFEASSGTEDADPASDQRLEHKLAILKQLYGYFHENWAKPFGITRDETKPLVILSLRDRKAFDNYNVQMGVPLPPGVIAYYEPENRWIVAYNGVQSSLAKTEEEKAILNDGTMFHEGTHQLVDTYVNRERFGRDRISRTRWLDEGLCEFIGSVALDHSPGKKHWKLEQRPDQRLEELIGWVDAENDPHMRGMIQQLKQLWPMIKAALEQQGIKVEDQEIPKGFFLRIPDMVKCLIYPHVGPLVLKGIKGPLQSMLNDRVTSLMYAQSVMFWYFCKNYKNGKYWESLMRYMRWEWGLAGEVPPDVRTFDPRVQEQYLSAFKMAFREFEVDDIDREFWQYVDQVAREAFNRGIPSPPLIK